MLEITPIEFEEGDYSERVFNGEVLVWLDGEAVDWVEKCGKDLYELHQRTTSDYSLLATVRKYEVCLTVEDISNADELRSRCFDTAKKIVELTPYSDLTALAIELKRDLYYLETYLEKNT